jgi:hypothetical protein
MAASGFGASPARAAPKAQGGTNAKDEIEWNRGKLYARWEETVKSFS